MITTNRNFFIEKSNKICDELKSLQYQSGEFGKGCESAVIAENQHRHSSEDKNFIQNVKVLRKPNCSISLIAALGIKALKGINDESVTKTYKWFSTSEYISNGWFQQELYQLDNDPFGSTSVPIKVQDVRHTATALLGVLNLGETCVFGTTAFKNLTQENVFDMHYGGWTAIANVSAIANHYDFYTTVYMLDSLNIIIKNNLFNTYAIGNEKINQLINNGINAICSSKPDKLGYNDNREQVLRANATLLFFCADLISERNNSFFLSVLDYLIELGEETEEEFCWNNDLHTTINVLAGIVNCLDYISNDKLCEIEPIIDKALKFISNKSTQDYRHPACLGFLLCIYSRLKEQSSIDTLNLDDAKFVLETLKKQIKLLDKFKSDNSTSKVDCKRFKDKIQVLIDSLTDDNYETIKGSFEKNIKPYIERDCGETYVQTN